MMKAASKRRQSVGNIAAVAMMLFLWLGTCALAASPELHRLIHKDAQLPTHNCVVTQLQQHSLLPGFVAVLAPSAPTLVVARASSSDFELFSSFDYRLPPQSRSPLGLVLTSRSIPTLHTVRGWCVLS